MHELMEEARSLSTTELDMIRANALDDLYFMSRSVLGYNLLLPHVDGPLCQFIDEETCTRRMMLMPRGHRKTTNATIADSIRVALRDPDQARILINNEVVDNAIAMIKEIMGHFENNELLRFLFKAYIPERFSGPGVDWSATKGVTLLRQRSWKEPTFLANGVGGSPTSKHFSHIKCDDLIGLEAVQSPATMARAKQWVDNIEPLTLGPGQTVIDFVGTRWAKNDLYAHVMESYGDRIKVFRRGMLENGVPIYPEMYSMDDIELLQRKPHIYYAQYENNPISSSAQDFNVALIRAFRLQGDEVVYTGADGVTVRANWRDMDRVLCVDPNKGGATSPDEAAIAVVAIDSAGSEFVLYDYGGRPSPSDFVDIVYQAAVRWRPRVIGIEDAGQQNTLFYFNEKCKANNAFFRAVPLKHRNVNKEERIRTALEPVVAERRMFLQPTSSVLRKQFADFPGSENDDRIDCVAYAQELLRKPRAAEAAERGRAAVDKILKLRNRVTGY